MEYLCKKCQLPVNPIKKEYYDLFEGMHWLCFHLTFEHHGNPDEPCSDPSCLHKRQEQLVLLANQETTEAQNRVKELEDFLIEEMVNNNDHGLCVLTRQKAAKLVNRDYTPLKVPPAFEMLKECINYCELVQKHGVSNEDAIDYWQLGEYLYNELNDIEVNGYDEENIEVQLIYRTLAEDFVDLIRKGRLPLKEQVNGKSNEE